MASIGTGGPVHTFVQEAVAATNGLLYRRMRGRLTAYPIPHLRTPPGEGRRLLDIGCNWGRWCIAAHRHGYRPIGIDPHVTALKAAATVARQVGVEAFYVAAEAQRLPFREASFDVVFSYSVLQHLSKENVVACLRDVSRVLRPGGFTMIQMANACGMRSLYHQMRRLFRPAKRFEVRFWTPAQLLAAFRTAVGPAQLEAEGYLSLNAQRTDMGMLSWFGRCVVVTSDTLRVVSRWLRPMRYVADSVYVISRKDQ